MKNRLEAWLAFISSDKPEDIMAVVRAFPDFRELYREVFEFRDQRRELISMYSKALSILDAGTVELMVEQQKRIVEKQKKQMKKMMEKHLEKQKQMEEEHQKVLEEQKQKAEEQQKVLDEQQKALDDKDKELARLRALLREKEKPE